MYRSILWTLWLTYTSTFFRRPFHFTPLSDGSPYDAAVLAFLFLSVRGAFALAPIDAYGSGDFSLREEAKPWPLLCHVDNSSGKINVSLKSHILSDRVSFFSAWLKSACYAGHTTVEKLGRRLFRGVRTSQTCFNCQWLTGQRHEKNMHPNRM